MSGDGDGMPERWIEQHAGCACSRFTDFSVACGKELVSGIEHVVRRALPASTGVPTVVWIDNGDTDGSVACDAESGSEIIYLAKASCVTWTTTLLAYVHALSHVLCRMICNFLCAEDDSGQQEKDPRHGVDWRRAVDWIEAHLVGNANYLGRGTRCLYSRIDYGTEKNANSYRDDVVCTRIFDGGSSQM